MKASFGSALNAAAPTAEVRRNARRFQYVSDEFPTPLNREFWDAIREFESGMRFLVATHSVGAGQLELCTNSGFRFERELSCLEIPLKFDCGKRFAIEKSLRVFALRVQ